MFLILILIGLAIYFAINGNLKFEGFKSSGDAAIEILKQKFVNGEIDEETYKKKLSILKG
jgi:uncharacterized membrane protein